jgi:hypothetical protein
MLKSFWFWFFITFIAIQFIPMDVPAKLDGNPENEIEAPKEVMKILKRSCYVCHSNSMVYPWYDKIAPASWYAKLHVRNGRRAVNFSNWKEHSSDKQFKVMDKLPKSIAIRMPLPTYLWLHKDATLSSDEKKLLKKWAENLKENIK